MRKAARRWLLACSMAVPGQIPAMPPRDVPPSQTGTAVIKGLVVDATTGAAVPRARVRLQGRLTDPPTTLTDSSGAFAFTQLPAGSYAVSAERVGYLAGRFPETGRTLRTAAPLTIRDGETLDTVTVSMSRGGVIAGRVLDSYGDPIEYVDVRAMRLPPSGRLTSAVARSNAGSNDLGEFRLSRLEPGSYILLATPRSIRLEEAVGPQPSPTYYPGVPSLDQAQPITLKRGDSAAGLILTMVEGIASVVSGTVIDSAGQRMSGNVSVSVRTSAKGVSTSSGTGLRPDGTFRVALAPGDYEIEARSTGQGPPETRTERVGLRRLSVAGGAISDLTIVLREPATVTGRVVFEGTSPLPSNRDVMRVDFWSETGSSCHNARYETAENWTFTVRGLVGTCRMRVGIGERSWTLKTVKIGTVDVTDRAVTFEPGQVVRDVQIVLTDRRTELALQVADERGLPTREYVAIVFSIDAERWTEQGTRYVRTYVPPLMRPPPGASVSMLPGMPPGVALQASAPQTISGLPAGEYYVVAVDDIEAEYARDPELLQRLVPHATRLRLVEGALAQVPLRRIPIRPASPR